MTPVPDAALRPTDAVDRELWGPEDVAAARIHASDERVEPSETENMIVTQALVLERLAEGARVETG